jgi:hypothetical protein
MLSLLDVGARMATLRIESSFPKDIFDQSNESEEQTFNKFLGH